MGPWEQQQRHEERQELSSSWGGPGPRFQGCFQAWDGGQRGWVSRGSRWPPPCPA